MNDALFSQDLKCRYWLTREIFFSLGKPKQVTWIMLNPSYAGVKNNDPTMGRVIEFSASWGYELAKVVNLFAWITSDPKCLPADKAQATGIDNWKHVSEAVREAQLVVCAWGTFPGARVAGREMQINLLESGIRPLCLGRNKNGSPKHPLYLRKDTPLIPFYP
jgi:hypothetical protein